MHNDEISKFTSVKAISSFLPPRTPVNFLFFNYYSNQASDETMSTIFDTSTPLIALNTIHTKSKIYNVSYPQLHAIIIAF